MMMMMMMMMMQHVSGNSLGIPRGETKSESTRCPTRVFKYDGVRQCRGGHSRVLDR